ncbi:MAG: MetQ/NlpA family ABC transporter substrate-binding protein [Clostridioides sp.]|nr:MetQ/NlpA family ABC transporter substrate-binding protein [Clostridioides sp.]
MKAKKLLGISLSVLLTLGAAGCSSKPAEKEAAKSGDDKVIVVGATPNPHAEILEQLKPVLKEKGYELQVKVFNDYVIPNTALSEGSLDANYFQHIPYLEETVKEKGYKLTSVAKIHLEPLGLYSKELKDVKNLKDGATIAIPNDATNMARALKLLADNGVLKVKDAELITKNDITENPKKIVIKELNAEQLATVLQDVDAAVINTNYALTAKLNPTKDALILEAKDSPYSNVIATREDNKDSEKIKALVEAIQSDQIKKFIEEKYEGCIIPSF